VIAADRFADLPEPILVVGGYGYRNVGDDAMLAGLLELLRNRRVTVVSRAPAETSAMHGVPSVGLGSAARALRAHRSVVIGGGALFGRDMGRVGRLLPAFGLLAAKSGRQVFIEGVSLDRNGRGVVADRAVRELLRAAGRVVVRDSQSAEAASEMGIDASIAPDLSAHMPLAPTPAGRQLLRLAKVQFRSPIVALCVTAVNCEVAERLEPALIEAIESLAEVEWCLVPFSQHPFVASHNDLLFARRIQSLAPQVRIVDGHYHPALVMAMLRHASVVVGMRYHSLVFAERLQLPLVPISYATKCDSWLKERGLTSTLVASGAVRAALGELFPLERLAG
jgi:polysaccharide pyruvyl transferase WcaK-like protein